jgi:branched-chain amino acid transport system permease protein
MTPIFSKTSALIDRFGGVMLLPVLLAIIAFIFIGRPATWVTLTMAGLAMGMMIFLMASGLSLIFGLMDVLNFGHSAFVTAGAFIGATVLVAMSGWVGGPSPFLNLSAWLIALAAAAAFGALSGWIFEWIIIRPVYGDHLRQILITVGALIVAEEIVLLIWGGAPLPVPRPEVLTGSIIIGDISVEIYRIFAFGLGLLVYLAMHLTLNRTRIGLLIRAGVENREMVEALGFRIDRLFIAVFMVGSALAAMGGSMWASYQGLITASLGGEVMILVFIVVIIGGLGSIQGSLLGALTVGLMANYVAFLFPKMALASNMLLMMAILLWRPYGLLPAVRLK